VILRRRQARGDAGDRVDSRIDRGDRGPLFQTACGLRDVADLRPDRCARARERQARERREDRDARSADQHATAIRCRRGAAVEGRRSEEGQRQRIHGDADTSVDEARAEVDALARDERTEADRDRPRRSDGRDDRCVAPSG
jgi:hypothetical protein